MSPEREAGKDEQLRASRAREVERSESAQGSAGAGEVVGAEERLVEVIEQRISLRRGPVPSPDDLQEYDRVLPGAADRLISMAERQAEHRQYVERRMVDAGTHNTARGQVLGFILALIVVVLGFVLLMAGKETAGLVALILPLATLAGAFIYGEVRGRSENGSGSSEASNQAAPTPATKLRSRFRAGKS